MSAQTRTQLFYINLWRVTAPKQSTHGQTVPASRGFRRSNPMFAASNIRLQRRDFDLYSLDQLVSCQNSATTEYGIRSIQSRHSAWGFSCHAAFPNSQFPSKNVLVDRHKMKRAANHHEQVPDRMEIPDLAITK